MVSVTRPPITLIDGPSKHGAIRIASAPAGGAVSNLSQRGRLMLYDERARGLAGPPGALPGRMRGAVPAWCGAAAFLHRWVAEVSSFVVSCALGPFRGTLTPRGKS